MNVAKADDRTKGLIVKCRIYDDDSKRCPRTTTKRVGRIKCYRCPHVTWWLRGKDRRLQEVLIVDVE